MDQTFDDFASAEERGFDRLKGRVPTNKSDSPFLPLASTSQLIAETFYKKYLDLWSKNCTTHFVQLSTIVSAFKLFNFGYVDKFFPTDRITYNQFFQFVCIMSLFDFQQIVSLMIGICRIQSNVMITYDQVIDIVRVFDKERLLNLDEFFEENMINVPDTKRKTYSLKAFITFINSKEILQKNFVRIQTSLISQILTEKHKNIILNRYQFFTLRKKGNVTNDLIPKESCFNVISRRISGEPPPYHYDYKLSNTKTEFLYTENNIDVLVLLIKQNYGYGNRTSRSSRALLNGMNYSTPKSSFVEYSNNNTQKNSYNNNLSTFHSPSLSISPLLDKDKDNNLNNTYNGSQNNNYNNNSLDKDRILLRNKINGKRQKFMSIHSIKVVNANHTPYLQNRNLCYSPNLSPKPFPDEVINNSNNDNNATTS